MAITYDAKNLKTREPTKYWYTLQSFPIDCEFYNGIGWSLFHPSFSQSTQYTATPNMDDGCAEPGCYEDQVTYSHDMDDIESIISWSTEEGFWTRF